MEDLAALWREQQHATFPASCLRLAPLDVSVGACLTASLRTDGVPRPLDPSRREELARGLDLVRRALAEGGLDDPAKVYFERLARLADAVLRG